MWNPRCVSDPGKVTDAEYFCSTLRRRWRAHELGRAEPRVRPARGRRDLQRPHDRAIGLVKAAHLYFRARRSTRRRRPTSPTTPTRSRPSCNDLIGGPPDRAEHQLDAGRPVRPVDDRGGLRAGRRDDRGGRAPDRPDDAVQLPADPAAGRACGLRGHRPARRSSRRTSKTGWAAGRSRTQGVVRRAGPDFDWVARHVAARRAPGRRGVRGATRQAGNCDGGAGDVSGVHASCRVR